MGCGGSKSTATSSQGKPKGGKGGKDGPKPILYVFGGSPPSRATGIMARAVGIEVELKFVNLFKGENKEAEYMKLNPLHQVPTLVDGDFVLTESRAIMTYLVNQYAPGHHVYPEDLQKRACVDKWLMFDAACISAHLGPWMGPQIFFGKPADAELEAKWSPNMDILNAALGECKFVTGAEPCLADISMFCIIAQAVELLDDFSLDKWANVKDWYARIRDSEHMKEYHAQWPAKVKEGIVEFKEQQQKAA